ncbi:hypothetical protein NF681_11480 [Comamonadaceae bacterium OTU4NAUVB1]|nr:hypothetical protein NF681_11480 [Comamonadaceae bacterium OTU4NAUVB1]
MLENTRQIIGLEKAIVSNQSGAVAHFHVVKQYTVSHISKSSAVTLAGYVSREMFDAGKDPVLLATTQIPAMPVSGRIEDLPTWFIQQLLAASGHDYVGATPVHAPVDGMAEQAVGPGVEEPAA